MARRDAKRAGASPPARELTLAVRAVGARGDGVAAGPDGEVFIPFTLAGERVRARVAGERGDALEIITANPHRVDAPCAHFGRCGGCQLQHWSLAAQRVWKRDIVFTALARAGLGEAPVLETIGVPVASRRRATFAIEKRRGRVEIGFHARASHAVEMVRRCEVLRADLHAALPALLRVASAVEGDWRTLALSVTACDNGLDLDIRPEMRRAEPRGAALLALIDRLEESRVVRASWNGAALVEFEKPVVTFGDIKIVPPAGGFLQASAEGEAAVLALIAAQSAGARRVVDLFCGAGAFALPLAKRAAVAAYDGDDAAIAALTAAARHAGARPVKAERRDLFERPLSAQELAGADLVVFDPPRAGARAQAQALATSNAPRIVGVSCNPATFARDAALICGGGYRLVAVTPIDQFVHSPHVELVGVFHR